MGSFDCFLRFCYTHLRHCAELFICSRIWKRTMAFRSSACKTTITGTHTKDLDCPFIVCIHPIPIDECLSLDKGRIFQAKLNRVKALRIALDVNAEHTADTLLAILMVRRFVRYLKLAGKRWKDTLAPAAATGSRGSMVAHLARPEALPIFTHGTAFSTPLNTVLSDQK